MPTITVSRERLSDDLQTRLGDKELTELLSQLGVEVEDLTESEVQIEVFPNRPDLLSTPGLIRNLQGLLGEEKGLPSFSVREHDYEVIVDNAVEPVRPQTSCAVVKNLRLDKGRLEELITLQEKLHVTYGREREKCAIGLYPLDNVSFPVSYTAMHPDEIAFKPLDHDEKMKASQILGEHSKGKKYQNLLADEDKYPVFIDNSNDFLSIPPIINSEKTGRVTEKTTDLFIECSGFDQTTVNKALNIVAAHLSDIGGELSRVTVSYDDAIIETPTIDSTEERQIAVKQVNEWLGTNLSASDMVDALRQMRHLAKISNNGENINVSNATYRTDLLGSADFYEETAIGIGYNNIEPDSCRVHTRGYRDKETRYEDLLREIMVGSGFQEVYTYSLCNADQAERLTEKDVVTLENSLSDRYDALRPSLMHPHLDVLSDNAHHSYPQKYFETGIVFHEDIETIGEERVLTATISGEENSFTDLQELLARISERFEIPLLFESSDHPAMIEGRTSSLVINNNDIGILGEIHPQILANYEVKQPTAVFEINLESIPENL